MMQVASFPMEFARLHDCSRDFCLWDYRPPSRPAPDGIRGVSLLYAAASTCSDAEALAQLVANLRALLGDFATVWGLKWLDGSLSAEFYFYDYRRTERQVSLERIAQAFAPLADVEVWVDEAIPYFMASVEVPLSAGGARHTVEVADIYIGNPDETGISSGLCYEAGPGGIRLKNLYYFFDAQSSWDAVLAKAACSAHIPMGSVDCSAIFPDWLREAQVAVVANKPLNDGAYFSRIGVDALIRFLREFSYPAELVDFAITNRDQLSHLLFDVGYDYRVADGRVVFGKSSIYNVF